MCIHTQQFPVHTTRRNHNETTLSYDVQTDIISIVNNIHVTIEYSFSHERIYWLIVFLLFFLFRQNLLSNGSHKAARKKEMQINFAQYVN